MEYLKVIITSVVSLVELFFLTKLVGNKQLSELTMFDYVISISIGSIAAEMATELEKPLYPFLAMLIYAVVSYFISIITSKSIKLRRFIIGKSLVLMIDGKLIRKNFKKGHIDLNEFLMQARCQGYFNISEVKVAILEDSGNISFMPYQTKRPVNPSDINVIPNSEDIYYNVIMDGVILKENLERTKKDEDWVVSKLKEMGVNDISNVFLAILDKSSNLHIFLKNPYEDSNDSFQ